MAFLEHIRLEASRSKRKGEGGLARSGEHEARGPGSAAEIWPFLLLPLRSAKREVAESASGPAVRLSAVVSFPTPGLRLC